MCSTFNKNVLSLFLGIHMQRGQLGSKVGESRFRMRTHVAHVVTRHARHTARARAPRARLATRAGLAGWPSYRPIGIAGGNQTSTLETRARTWNDQAKRTYYLYTCRPAGLVWQCAAVLSCWDPYVTHTEPRSPPRLHHVASTRFSRPSDCRLQPN